SAVEALRYAIQLQRGMAERNIALPEEKRIEFRVGINVGDVIVNDGDFWGETVNIAARLEAMARPGGICISGRVRDDVEGKLDISFDNHGHKQLKNIARPVHVYSVRAGDLPRKPMPPVPDKPSIAVLPFHNLSRNDTFADGMLEEIITALARVK